VGTVAPNKKKLPCARGRISSKFIDSLGTHPLKGSPALLYSICTVRKGRPHLIKHTFYSLVKLLGGCHKKRPKRVAAKYNKYIILIVLCRYDPVKGKR